MEDVLKEIGLLYARSLPAALASVLVPLAVLGWLAAKANETDAETRRIAWGALAIVAVVFIVQAPAAYDAAKAACKEDFQKATGQSLVLEPALADRIAKCERVWPAGVR